MRGKKSEQASSLPVLMFHGINARRNADAISPEQFAEQCRALALEGWRGVSLAEAEAFLADNAALPEKSVLLTFDDGYLDNYLYALPALQRHGHCGVMFAVLSRLESGAAPRVPMEDVLAGRVPHLPEVLNPVQRNEHGFLVRRDIFCNHAEIAAMDKSGIMAVAAHTHGHYGVFAGPEYTEARRPGDQPYTFYHTEQEPLWGLPDFAVRPGLRFRAFLPDPELMREVRALVPQEEGAAADFFAAADKQARLQALLAGYAGRLGRFETDEERRERMRREIARGKEELESLLSRTVHSMAWPWGRCCEEAQKLAVEAGFRVLFTVRRGVNPPGKALSVHRFAAKADKNMTLLYTRIYSRPRLGALYAMLRRTILWAASALRALAPKSKQ